MNSLEGFKDFDKVIRPSPSFSNHGPNHTIPSIGLTWAEWKAVSANDFSGIFEVVNYKITHKMRKYDNLIEMLAYIDDRLPTDVFMRLHCCTHKARPVIVRILGWTPHNGKAVIHIEHSERFCYNTPVAGSMGGNIPEPQ